MIYGKSWKQFSKDLINEVVEDDVSNGAATLAFYLMLAIFPAMIVLLTTLPYLPVPNLQQAIMDFMVQALPPEAAKLLQGTVTSVVSDRHGGLLAFGVLVALWSASSGVYAVMQQLTVTYDVKDARSYFKSRTVAFFLTLAFGALIITAFAFVVFGGVAQDWLSGRFSWGLPLRVTFELIRWAIILIGLLAAFALMYYFGPDVDQDFRFITPGSVLGVILLSAAAVGFRVYVENFANYSAVYGSLGAVIVLLFWLYLLGWVILLGSELNALIEHYSPEGKSKGQRNQPGR